MKGGVKEEQKGQQATVQTLFKLDKRTKVWRPKNMNFQENLTYQKQYLKQGHNQKSEWFISTCHYSKKLGHIRPHCRLYLDDKRQQMLSYSNMIYTNRRFHRAYVVHTSNNSRIGN